jgi:hypothetical protein
MMMNFINPRNSCPAHDFVGWRRTLIRTDAHVLPTAAARAFRR